MADPTQPNETVLFESKPTKVVDPTDQQSTSQIEPPLAQTSSNIPLENSSASQLPPTPAPETTDESQPVQLVESLPAIVTSETQTETAQLSDSSTSHDDVIGFNNQSGEVIVLHQPLSLLIVRLIGVTIVYFVVLWLLHSVLVALLGVFPELAPNYPVNDFLGSPMFFWGSILFIFIVIGIILRWWTIFFQISSSEVVAHSGIIIKQAKVLKRIGISVRQIEIKRNLLGMLLNYVTIEIGSEVMGGVSMTISDRAATLQTLTDALKPGEVLQTKKLF